MRIFMLYYFSFGALAQLGARHTGSVEVTGSNPVCSIVSVKNRTLSWEFGFLVHYNKLLYHSFHKMFRILFCQKNVIDSSTYRI